MTSTSNQTKKKKKNGIILATDLPNLEQIITKRKHKDKESHIVAFIDQDESQQGKERHGIGEQDDTLEDRGGDEQECKKESDESPKLHWSSGRWWRPPRDDAARMENPIPF